MSYCFVMIQTVWWSFATVNLGVKLYAPVGMVELLGRLGKTGGTSWRAGRMLTELRL
jgi:hypothetical protein